ncbi:MAG: metallophosphoesterase [Leptonema sp. (in: Bacteria)]|nr:metallophosphoesterase [Leptonema sp. (in: bacteria)]
MFSILKQKQIRTIMIGDVHGCLDELQLLVRQLKLSKEDRVIMLGDLINRGPDSVGCVDFVASNGFDCLLGNHEDEYLNEFESNEKFAHLRKSLGDFLHQFITKRPLWIETPNYLCVHAGLKPGVKPAIEDRHYLLNIRTWDGIGVDIKTPTNKAWYEFHTGKRPVFYGHWARKGLNLRSNTFGLDSGCVYGKALSAYIFEEKKLVQQPAKRTYYVPPSLRPQTTNSI